jgi:hypothetical protein
VQEAEAAADVSRGNLSGDAKHGRVACIGSGECRRRVEHAGAGNDEAGANAARGLRVAKGHVRRRLFVAGMDDADRILPAIEGVENIIEL